MMPRTERGIDRISQCYTQAALAPANASMVLWLFEDGVSLGRVVYAPQGLPAAASVVPLPLRLRTPSAGSRTYSIRGTVLSGADCPATDSSAFMRINRA
jgi:hypothetical protein